MLNFGDRKFEAIRVRAGYNQAESELIKIDGKVYKLHYVGHVWVNGVQSPRIVCRSGEYFFVLPCGWNSKIATQYHATPGEEVKP